MKSLLIEYMRLFRAPGLAGLALTPVAGALAVNNTSFTALSFLFIIGVISKIYGFVMNDYFDIEIDKSSKDLSQRPLVKETISKRNAQVIILLCFFLGYIAIFGFFYRPHHYFYMGLLCIIIADVLTITYNKFGKRIVGSDFIIALAESLFLLFGALMVLRDQPLDMFFWIIFIILFNEQFYMNAIAGGLKDIDHDPLMHVHNIAISSGVKLSKNREMFMPFRFKVLGLGERFFSAILVFVPFVFFGIDYELWQIGILVLCVILVIFGSWKMLHIKQFDRIKIRRLIGGQLLIWHPLIPIMLISKVGWVSPFVLGVVPAIGFFLCSALMGQRPRDAPL